VVVAAQLFASHVGGGGAVGVSQDRAMQAAAPEAE